MVSFRFYVRERMRWVECTMVVDRQAKRAGEDFGVDLKSEERRLRNSSIESYLLFESD